MSSKRLKHFCQLCRKQCKDQNGFKCHINSESHQMRVREFASNPLEHIEKASREFEWRFIQMLKTKYPGEPKYLEELYNQLIEQKKFLKFNHTQWRNLTQFGQFLQNVKNLQVIGNPPNCKVVYTVNKTKDFIQATKKQKLEAQKEKQKEQLQKSIAARIQKQREFQRKKQQQLNEHIAHLQQQQKHLVVTQKLQFNINGFNSDNKRSAFFTVQELQREVKQNQPMYHKKVNNIERLYEQLKKKDARVDEGNEEEEVEWIQAGITVKIKPHEIDPAFHNKKCRITRVVEPYVAELSIGTAKIQIDQTYLQTVIPKIGNQVMVLLGKRAGQIGVLREANLTEGYGVVQCKSEKLKISFNFFSRYDEQ